MFCKRLFLWFALACACGNPAFSQVWKPAPMHGGGYVTGLSFHPTDPNTLVARTDVGGLYKTSDGATSWQPLYTGLVKSIKDNFSIRAFVYKPGDAQTQYFTSGRGNRPTPTTSRSRLWTSTDGGATFSWERLPFSVNGNEDGRWVSSTLIIDPANTGKMIIGAQPSAMGQPDGGVWYRTAAGGAFQALPGSTDRLTKSNITKVAFKPGNANIVYFSALNVINREETATSGGFYQFDFGAGTLTTLFEDIPIYDFDFDAGNPDEIVLNNKTGVYLLNAATNSRSVITPAGVTSEWGHFITTDPAVSGKWYIGSYNFNRSAIFYTENHGATYTEVRYNNGNNVTTNSQKLDYSLPYNLNGELYKFGNYMSKLIFSPTSPGTAYITDFASIWKTNDAAALFATGTNRDNNAAWTWRASSNGIHIISANRVSPDPSNPAHFFINVNDQGYFRTTDNGTTLVYNRDWASQTPSILFINETHKTLFSPVDPTKAYLMGAKQGSTGGRFERSTNGGATWTEPTPDAATSFLYLNTTDVSDGTISADGSTIVVGVVPKNTSTAVVLKSTDEGATWINWAEGLTLEGIGFTSFTDQNRLLTDANGTTFYVWSTRSLARRGIADAAWTHIALPAGVTGIDAIVRAPQSGVLYAALTNNQLYKLEAALSASPVWTPLPNQPFAAGVQDLAISTGGRLLALSKSSATATTDSPEEMTALLPGGTNWIPVSLAGTMGYIDNMFFTSENSVALIAAGDGAFLGDLSVVLPLTLTQFSVTSQACRTGLKWTVDVQNEASARIELQKGDNGSFATFKTFPVASGQQQYSLSDTQSAVGAVCYRLKLVQTNGSLVYSDIRCMAPNAACASRTIEVAFSQGTQLLTVKKVQRAGPAHLYSSTGQLVKTFSLQPGDNVFNLSHLAKGTYLVKVMSATKPVLKFSKAR